MHYEKLRSALNRWNKQNTQTQHFMAEFITEHDADCKYGSKNRTNAALTLKS